MLTLYFSTDPVGQFDLQTVAANILAVLPTIGIIGGGDGDDTTAITHAGLVYATGQRIDFTGGRDAETVFAAEDRGLFVYTNDSTPEWNLRLRERQIEVLAVRAGLTFSGSGDAGLRLQFGDTDRNDRRTQIVGTSDYAEPRGISDNWSLAYNEVDDWRGAKARYAVGSTVVFSASDIGVAGNAHSVRLVEGGGAVAGVAATLDWQNTRFSAAGVGTIGNTLDVLVTEGTAAADAVPAVRAQADLLLGGIIVMRVRWPEANARRL